MTDKTLNEQALDAAARAIWESETHPLMASAGHATDWEGLNPSVKRSVKRKARLAIKTYLEQDAQQ